MQGPLGKHLGVGELEEAGAEGPGLTTHGEDLVRAAGGAWRFQRGITPRFRSIPFSVLGRCRVWEAGVAPGRPLRRLLQPRG